MTDLLYIVRQSGWGYDEELRYSLRSVEKYARNVGRIFVCGDIPDFLSDEVVKISCSNPFDRKAKNIMYRLDYVVKNYTLSEHFLMSSDDIFLHKITDLDNYPHYWKNGAEISVPAELENTKIGRITSGAHDILAAFDYPLQDYGGGHCFHWVYQELWNNMPKIKRVSMQSKYGVPVDLLLGGAIAKIYNPQHIARTDYKFDYVPKASELRGADCFSTGDRPDLWGGDKWLQKLYPNKSRWEK